MPTESRTPYARTLALLRRSGVMRLRDFQKSGIAKAAVLRLAEAGQLERIGRGLYALPGREVSESEALVQVAKRVPDGVACLLTALVFHNLTDQNPSKVWLAIDRKAREPQLDWPPLEVVWWSSKLLAFGVTVKTIGGVPVKVTTPAKTVADCLKYRNKIGTDVAIQAIRDYRRSRRSIDDLFEAARVCRVERTLRTYLEAMT
ncbi:MAG TPA: type IV toxin-antitoxin system AbiEi family antitoxin domain-containing protein [Polyangiaceae bacterium]|nr:type IV toxin-antitoxin system AbiEi family antitoxin domain-containing protein [Polyangiaceae bacterium]